MPQNTTLVGSKEVCERLGIDRSTLTRKVAAGRIKPAMRLPGPTGAFLFHPTDVDELEAVYAKKSA